MTISHGQQNKFMNVDNTNIDNELGPQNPANDKPSNKKIQNAFMRSHKKNHQSRVMIEKIMEQVA